MLLKVEAYESGSKTPSHPPLHICLATADESTGIALSVGRKEGLVQFSNDKSVSRREHCLLKFVSTTEPSFPCATPEQGAEVDPWYNMAVVLESKGKFGNIWVREPEPQTSNHHKEDKDNKEHNNDSATDGDSDTDDDQPFGTGGFVSQASASVNGAVLSVAGQAVLGDEMARQVHLEFLAAEQSRVLKSLARPGGRAIVQCGKMGSTIVLTRVDLLFGRSGLPAKQKNSWTSKLHWFGAKELTKFSFGGSSNTSNEQDEKEDKHSPDPQSIDLLVVKERDPSTKQLAAWSCHIPIVLPTFLEAFLDRKNPSDPLPSPQDYAPPESEDYPFWNQVTPSSSLLQGATFVSTKDGDDAELLTQAAGASILKLYEASAPTKALQGLEGCFGLSNTRKLTSFLKKARIPLITVRTLAKAITSQDASVIDPTIGEAVAQSRVDPSKTNDSPPVIGEQMEQEADAETNAATKAGSNKTRPSTADGDENGGELKDTLQTDKNEENEEEHDSIESKGRQEKDSNKTQPMETDSPVQKEKATRTSSRREQQDDKQEEEEEEEDSISQETGDKRVNQENSGKRKGTQSQRASQRPSQSSQWLSSGGGVPQEVEDYEMQVDEEEKQEESSPIPSKKRREERVATLPKPKRPRLSTASDGAGWLEVAPKEDKQRRALARSEEEIREIMGYDETEELVPQAKTQVVAGMVGPAVGQSTIRAATSRRRDVPDFRAFRKNVVAGYHDRGNYRLRLECPKESAAQVFEHEEQRQALEEQQRRADALFRDTGPKTAAARRRRQ